jgi:hypothetical protein
MLGDGAFDARPVLNAIASRGCIPMAKRRFDESERVWS